MSSRITSSLVLLSSPVLTSEMELTFLVTRFLASSLISTFSRVLLTMTEMFELLKELTTSRAFDKVLMREEAKHPVTKNVNYVSLISGEEEKSDDNNAMIGDSIEKPDGLDAEVSLKEVEKENEAKNGTKNEPIKSAEKELIRAEEDEAVEAPSSQPIGYYLKHIINEKLIEGLVDNHRFKESICKIEKGIKNGIEPIALL
nr:hypothetical protein [Tanacetum cinerariifolium]